MNVSHQAGNLKLNPESQSWEEEYDEQGCVGGTWVLIAK